MAAAAAELADGGRGRWREPGAVASHRHSLYSAHASSPGLASPQQIFADVESTEIVEMAGACTVGIVRNDLFVDGDKRSCFLIGVLFFKIR